MNMREKMESAAERTACWDADADGIRNWSEVIDAILDAMREPIRGVRVAGEDVNEYEYGDSERGWGGGYIDPTPAWQAMIDAIKGGA